MLKAIREGKTNVDLNVPETPDGGGDGDGTTGGGTQGGGSGTTGDQGTSGGNTGSEEGGSDNVDF